MDPRIDARLTELEIKASLAEDTIDRLNEVVASQQQRIDALARELARLARRLRDADEPGARDAGDEVPPHW
ncbi:MAG TPA: SlyX family protein [Burkholderiaceae bacterium]|nr:SlyX family protein [Burkholderiaceae bacterium]